jgi:RNA polymerase sigma-70 factor (ECF subfamily)
LLGFARKALYSSDGAEDVVQETFARALRSKNRYDPELGTLRTWLFTIERKVIIDTIARQARARVPLLQEVSEDHVESAMLGWQMEAALLKLAPEHRLVITEIYFNGRTGREVAELFDIPEGTVRSRLFYAIRELRVLFEEGK